MASLELREHNKNGLRPRRDQQRNEPYWRDCTNKIPSERGGVPPLQVTFPVDDTLSMSWPFPQVLRDERMYLYMQAATLNTLDTSAYPYAETAKTIYGSQNLAVNPYFNLDATWSKGAGWTITGGVAVATGAISTDLSQAGILDGASSYLVVFTVTRSAGSITPTCGTQAGTARSSSNTFAEVIVANGTGFKFATSGFTGTVDNVYVYRVAAISSSGAWQLAAFHDRVAFLGNGNTFVFLKPGNVEISSVPQWQRVEDLVVGAVGKHNNSLVLGGMSGARLSDSVVTTLFTHWKELTENAGQLTTEDDTLDTSYIFFSAPGGAENDRPFTVFLAALGIGGADLNDALRGDIDTYLETYQIGFFRPKHCGPLRTLKQCGNDLIAYGQNGVSRLRRGENGHYIEQKLIENGVPSRTAVCGDETGHVCATTHDELWFIGPEGPAQCLHYSEHISTMTASSVVASYDPTNKWYYFADGTYCYVLSLEQGRPALGNSNAVIPSSLLRIENTADLYGTAITANNPTAGYVQYVAVSQPDQTTFDISSMDVELSEGTADDVTVTADVRMAKSGPFKRNSTLTTVDDRGRGFCKRTGAHMRPYVKTADYRYGTLSAVHLNIGQGRKSIAALADQSDTVLTETYP